jgi:hypothetical protein
MWQRPTTASQYGPISEITSARKKICAEYTPYIPDNAVRDRAATFGLGGLAIIRSVSRILHLLLRQNCLELKFHATLTRRDK